MPSILRYEGHKQTLRTKSLSETVTHAPQNEHSRKQPHLFSRPRTLTYPHTRPLAHSVTSPLIRSLGCLLIHPVSRPRTP